MPKPNGRILRLEQLRNQGACGPARMLFRETWGTQTLVNQKWAREAVAAGFTSSDFNWASERLLPGWAADIYFNVRDDYWRVNMDKWNYISAAIFAALYVETHDA